MLKYALSVKTGLIRLLSEDKKIDWELFISRHQEYSPAFAYLITASLIPKNWSSKTTGINFSFRFFKRVGDEYYWSVSDYKKLIKLLEKKGNSNPQFYINIIKRAEEYCENLNELALRMRGKDFSNTSNKKLLLLLEDYWEHLRKAAAFMLVKHNLNRVLEKRIRDKLSQASNVEIFDKLLVPTKDTLITQANKKLSKLALKTEANSKEIDDWLSMYGWIETFTWLGKPLTKVDMKKKIAKLKNERFAEEEETKVNALKQKFRKNASLFAEIEALQYLLYFHTYEIECLFASHYWCKNLLKEISLRIGLPFEDYPYAIYPEIADALKGKSFDKEKILKRKNNQYAIYLLKGKIYVIEGKAFRKAKSNLFVQKTERTQLKGRPAFQGKVSGRTIIVKTIKDFAKFKKGDIVISPMTTVDFTPYLKGVKAIVTDEGGVTCHAAIVAREMQKPCIVGTKFATKIFKDGDFVEVDANEGIVRLIE